ncbi:GL25092 [Drosophila persimilis]|uniref:GL25092 n=1 Tax=Drosophila persimilis TaxID=7234 RepID=B4GU71_DROPE|nr:GL25092 [Drosophila persimilis]
MWSAKLLLFAAAGVSFLGYCIYFDRKRLAHPDYKRKVHERRQRKATARKLFEAAKTDWKKSSEQDVQERLQMQERMGIRGGGMVPSVNDDAASVGRKSTVQLHFESEFMLGENLLINGHVDEGLTHLSNAILLCSKPGSLLLSIQKSLPEQLTQPLLMRVAELQKQSTRELNESRRREVHGDDALSDDDPDDNEWNSEAGSSCDEWLIDGDVDSWTIADSSSIAKSSVSNSPDPPPIVLAAPS